jgi:hypothetical protein
MKTLSLTILVVLAVIAGVSTVPTVKFCSIPQQDLSWFYENAELLLFIEYLQKEATADVNSPWNSLSTSQDYQNKLAAMRDRIKPKPVAEEDCIPLSVQERLENLEVRPNGTESEEPSSDHAEGEVSAERMARLEHELRRHRAVLQRLRQGVFRSPEPRTIKTAYEYEGYERKFQLF